MVKSFRHALRRFGRQKLNTSFHIIGLTLGMTVCLVIGLFLQYELSFDNYHSKANRIYRVSSLFTDQGQKRPHYSTPTPLAETMRKEVTGVEKVALAHPVGDAVIEINPQKRFKQNNILITEPEFLDIFDIDMLKGNGREILKTPFQAILSETTARKFFGNEDPIGKTFKFKNDYTITVAGIMKDLPPNTNLPATMLMTYIPEDKFFAGGHNSWTFVSGTSTFVLFSPTADPSRILPQLKKIADLHINSAPGILKDSRSDFFIQPLRNIHFDAAKEAAGGGPWVSAVSTSWLWFFAWVGFAVLALACINFVNLSTAQALSRAREVGVRKSIGASRAQLIWGFLKEGWLLCIFSALLAIVITTISLPAINNLMEKQIVFRPLHSPGIWISLAAGIFFTGLFAGMYPAWVIAKFNPVHVLKAGTRTAGDQHSAWLRKGLIVIQFMISAGLLIALIVISQQVRYMHEKGLGFNKDNIVVVPLVGDGNRNLFANELKQMAPVKSFAFASATPSSEDQWGTKMNKTNDQDPNRVDVQLIVADENYANNYGIKLVAGRFLMPSDTNYTSNSVPEEKRINKLVVNEQLVKTMGWKNNEDALGKTFWFGFGGGHAEVVGVVADFNTVSLHEQIGPALITQAGFGYNEAGIKIIAGAGIPNTLAAIESAWKKAFPQGVFEYRFLDDQIDSYYKSEGRLFTFFKIFSTLAMVICCLGLWGLASIAAEKRVKEMGIRKVLGASVAGLVALLSRDFLKLVALALVIVTPLSWYFMNQWLQGFAFRINISFWVFVITGLISISITLLTVGFKAIRAATVNPAESLRSE